MIYIAILIKAVVRTAHSLYQQLQDGGLQFEELPPPLPGEDLLSEPPSSESADSKQLSAGHCLTSGTAGPPLSNCDSHPTSSPVSSNCIKDGSLGDVKGEKKSNSNKKGVKKQRPPKRIREKLKKISFQGSPLAEDLGGAKAGVHMVTGLAGVQAMAQCMPGNQATVPLIYNMTGWC